MHDDVNDRSATSVVVLAPMQPGQSVPHLNNIDVTSDIARPHIFAGL